MTIILLKLSRGGYIQFWYLDVQDFCGLKDLHKLRVLYCAMYCCNLLRYIKMYIMPCLTVVITGGNRIEKAGAESEKVIWLNCIIQPFARQYFDATSSLQMLAANDSKVYFFVRHLWRLEKLSHFLCILPSIIQDNSTFDGTKFTTSCSRYESYELYTTGTNNLPVMVSISFVNLEVTTVNKWQLQFIFFEVTWQQASKHLNKSIIGGNVGTYWSECLVVSGEEEAKGKFWSSWFKLCGMWHCFNW